MISADTTIARLLDQHPGLLDVLVDYHPHFKQLRNGLLRRVMAPRLTVGQAARIAGIETDALLRVLREAAGEAASAELVPVTGPEGPPADPMPALLAALPESRQVHVDVREDIRRGQEPFARIMAAVKGLPEGAALVLRAPFEPVPLYDVLGKRGFDHWTDCRSPSDWVVWFYREAVAAETSPAPRPQTAAAPTATAAAPLDVRGLEPPEPMVRVLAALETLGPGQTLEVLHERRPMFLYPQLDDRGFVHQTEELGPGLVRIVIRRGGGG